jgi:hypothetical protein
MQQGIVLVLITLSIMLPDHVGPPQHSDPTRWLRSWYERVCADWRAHAVVASVETERR